MSGYHYIVTNEPKVSRDESGRYRCISEVLVFRASGDSPVGVARMFAGEDSAFDRGTALKRAISVAHDAAAEYCRERNR